MFVDFYNKLGAFVHPDCNPTNTETRAEKCVEARRIVTIESLPVTRVRRARDMYSHNRPYCTRCVWWVLGMDHNYSNNCFSSNIHYYSLHDKKCLGIRFPNRRSMNTEETKRVDEQSRDHRLHNLLMTKCRLPTSVNKPLESIVEHDWVRADDDRIGRPTLGFDEWQCIEPNDTVHRHRMACCTETVGKTFVHSVESNETSENLQMTKVRPPIGDDVEIDRSSMVLLHMAENYTADDCLVERCRDRIDHRQFFPSSHLLWHIEGHSPRSHRYISPSTATNNERCGSRRKFAMVLPPSMFAFESIGNTGDSYRSLRDRVVLNCVAVGNIHDHSLVCHWISDGRLLAEFVCLFRIGRRTVRYTYRQKHSDAQERKTWTTRTIDYWWSMRDQKSWG